MSSGETLSLNSQEKNYYIQVKLKQQKGFLEELFKKKNKFEQGHEGKEKKQGKKKHAAHLMKKILQNLQPKSKSSTTASSKGNITGSVSSNKKLPQVITNFMLVSFSFKKKFLSLNILTVELH